MMSVPALLSLFLVFALLFHSPYLNTAGSQLNYFGLVFCEYPARMTGWNVVHLKTYKLVQNETEQRCSYEGMEQNTDIRGAFNVSVSIIKDSKVNSVLWIAHTCNYVREQSYRKYEPPNSTQGVHDAGRVNLTESYDCHDYIDPCPEYTRRKRNG